MAVDRRSRLVPVREPGSGIHRAWHRCGRRDSPSHQATPERGLIRLRRDRRTGRRCLRGGAQVTVGRQALGSRLLAPIGSRVALEVGSTFLGNAYAALAAFAAGTLLAHWLGPELRGTFELGLFAANSGLLVLGLGLTVP